MAFNKKSLKNLRPVVKGEIRNPEGARAHHAGMRAVKRLTILEVASIGELILQNDLEALQAIATEPGASVLKVWIASVAAKAIRKGDAQALNALLDRFIGKVPTQLVLQGSLRTNPAPVNLDKLSNRELADLEKLLTRADPAFKMKTKKGDQ